MLQPSELATMVFELTEKCFDALKSGQGGQVPLLRTARELLKFLPGEAKSKVCVCVCDTWK